MTPLLELDGITKRYGPNVVLDDVSLTVRKHEVIGLIGENGAGKSTLLKILAGVHRPDGGVMRVDGAELVFADPADAARHGVGVVHQEQSLLPNLSVAENLTLGSESEFTRFGLIRRGARRRAAQAMLDLVDSTVDPDTPTEDVGFAERQMIEVARAVSDRSSGHAPLLVLDEPTSVLQPADIEILHRRVMALREIGSVIFVSHRLDEVLRFSDRVFVLRDGKIVGERPTDDVDERELYAMMIGKEAADEIYCTGRREPVADVAPVLDARNVSVAGSVHDVSLAVRPGEVVCMVGVASSGREEFARAIFGAQPARGTVSIGGSGLPASPRRAVAAGVAYLPAERRSEGMVAGATVADNICLSHPARGRRGRAAAARHEAREWIEALHIRPDDPDLDIARLSGGNQQKAVLAKWIRDDGLSVLILDHPTRGLDIGAKEDVYRLIRDLSARGVGVLVLADTLDEAIGLGHRIVVLRDGRVTAAYDSVATEPPTKIELLEKMM
ncbi:sugar ABC transporter ATP-binding protein [Gordonia lacunae]|uniref:ABC transporter ATP-binding protein n=1 Tax=Gordonia lacunae TaxID=417102 RepID=A0A243Q764_9ACTN|nr:sugar ABC transporter ATP-binding protein [Gordonia lacunae]OUC76831.1 ABC transporter ATP-binding protein [Gordonia lacunae]